MTKYPSIDIHFHVPMDMLQTIDDMTKKYDLKNRAETIRALINGGIKLESFKDVDLPLEFLPTEEMLKAYDDKVFEWADNLTDEQKQLVIGSIRLSEEKTVKNKL